MLYSNNVKAAVASLSVLMLGACASTKSIPLTVQSDPLGAQVMLKLKGEDNQQTDWIYLGNTPLTTQRKVSTRYLNADHSFVLQVMKDGYSDQSKEWSGQQLEDASDGENRIFWNPRLVETNQ